MLSGTARPLAFAGLVFLFSNCDKKPVAAPTGDEALTLVSALAGLGSPANLLAAVVSSSEIGLSWQDNATNEAGFEIARSTTGPGGSFDILATTGANVVSYSDAGLSGGAQYCYKVRAFKRSGRKTSYATFSATACATTPVPPPAAPSNASARPTSSSAVAIVWIDNSATETGFRLERSANVAGPWTAIATVEANVTSAADAERGSEQQVCYRIIAVAASDESTPSNADCTVPPAGPTNLTASAVPQGVDLAWEDNSSVEEMYEVLRSVDGVTFTSAAWVPPSITTYHDAAATGTSTYWYQVRAVKDGGFSDLSNTASATTTCVPTSETEVCDNGVDDDCNGVTDSADPECPRQDCSFFHCPPGFICDFDGFCSPHCNDGQWNGDEGDVDCGGSCATKCQAGQHCWLHFDCSSGSCSFDICQRAGGAP